MKVGLLLVLAAASQWATAGVGLNSDMAGERRSTLMQRFSVAPVIRFLLSVFVIFMRLIPLSASAVLAGIQSTRSINFTMLWNSSPNSSHTSRQVRARMRALNLQYKYSAIGKALIYSMLNTCNDDVMKTKRFSQFIVLLNH